MTDLGPLLLAALGGYLLGSIPFGFLLTKWAGLGDIRAIGSGNIGATNVLRTGNKRLALLTLLLDGAKGAAALLIGAQGGPAMALAAGGGAMLGHLFPVWLKFKGGKGVATALGILLALDWQVGALACLTWLAAALLFRYSSLAALLALAAAPIYGYFLAGSTVALFALGLAILVWVRHHENIGRLLHGEESRIGAKKKVDGA
jgi:glycerol-3-phosphate acyltransferase PlsY